MHCLELCCILPADRIELVLEPRRFGLRELGWLRLVSDDAELALEPRRFVLRELGWLRLLFPCRNTFWYCRGRRRFCCRLRFRLLAIVLSHAITLRVRPTHVDTHNHGISQCLCVCREISSGCKSAANRSRRCKILRHDIERTHRGNNAMCKEMHCTLWVLDCPL